MKLSVVLAGLLSASTALATDFCGQWDTTTTSNGYIIYNNLWGEAEATSGSQCTGLDSVSGTKVAWHTSWTWAGGSSDVKSYANADLVFTPQKLSAISTIESTMIYSYTGTSIVADVAYDLFLASTSGGTSEYEIMIWLAALGGAGPISSTGSTVATPTIAGYSWKLYFGYNGSTKVYSFVASSQITSFTADIKLFLTYLVNNYSVSTSQYLNTLQAGTEPFTGTSAVLTVSEFSAVIA
ncbi:hypothetical protein RUND412_009269 [Rhizina undulata]